jgi:hypothetical protein
VEGGGCSLLHHSVEGAHSFPNVARGQLQIAAKSASKLHRSLGDTSRVFVSQIFRRRTSHRNCFWTVPRKTNLGYMTVTRTRHNQTTHSELTWCICNPQVYRRSQWHSSESSSYYKQGLDPLSAFMLIFLDIIQLPVVQTNRYHQYHDSLDYGRSPLPDVTLKEMFSFFGSYFADGA